MAYYGHPCKAVFEDIKLIRSWCDLPIDLHIITAEPDKYFDLLRENPVEYLTFQYEDLKSPLKIPSDITGKKGLAVITPTPISVFEQYSAYDFILIILILVFDYACMLIEHINLNYD